MEVPSRLSPETGGTFGQVGCRWHRNEKHGLFGTRHRGTIDYSERWGATHNIFNVRKTSQNH